MIIHYANADVEKNMSFDTAGSAGIDCVSTENVNIAPGDTKTVDLGFRVSIPRGYAGILVPRSGIGSKGLILGNTVGVVDSDYTGWVKANLLNRSKEHWQVTAYERVCQLLIMPAIHPQIEAVDENYFLNLETERGERGGINETNPT